MLSTARNTTTPQSVSPDCPFRFPTGVVDAASAMRDEEDPKELARIGRPTRRRLGDAVFFAAVFWLEFGAHPFELNLI